MADASKLGGSLASTKPSDVNKSVVDSLNKKQDETLTKLSNHKPKAETTADYLGNLMGSIPKDVAGDMFQAFNHREEKVGKEVDLQLQEIGHKVDTI
jgi:hypothetical protein